MILAGCASVSGRMDHLAQLLDHSGFRSETIQTPDFQVFSAFHPDMVASHNKSGRIYLEGDGYAWVTRFRVSDNPSPREPAGLQMAIASGAPAIYLARPCQFTNDSQCSADFWTYDRFHPRVVGSVNAALDKLKTRFGIESFELIGYSGGGYVAMLLAAKRSDISKVTTVAGVIDPAAWVDHHNVSPLRLSQTTDFLLHASVQTEFIHLCGGNDSVMPCALTRDFLDKANGLGLSNHKMQVVPGADHEAWMAYAARLTD